MNMLLMNALIFKWSLYARVCLKGTRNTFKLLNLYRSYWLSLNILLLYYIVISKGYVYFVHTHTLTHHHTHTHGEKHTHMYIYVIKPKHIICSDMLIYRSGELPNDEFADILKQIADDLSDEAKIDILGSQLGILQGDIARALKTNMRYEQITSRGTHLMLKQWRKGVSREDEHIQLRRALVAAKLLDLADHFFPKVRLS